MASGLLARRDLPSRVLAAQVDRVWQGAWRTIGGWTCLPGLVADQRYWRGEIESVIKGSRVREFPEYAGLDRPGRRTRLREEHRTAVRDLYGPINNS